MKHLLCIIALVAYTSAVSISSLADNLRREFLPRLTDTRIVGGIPVVIEKYPHQVNLRYKSFLTPEQSYSHYCGGSIYSERMIITAAHCIIGAIPKQFQVVAGSKNREGNDGYIVPVEEIIMNENYNPDTFDNDIAILVLGASLPLNNDTVKAIELAEHDNDTRPGDMATVTGWGTVNSNGDYAVELQEVKVPIISNEECSKAYYGRVTNSMVCAGDRNVGGKGSCQGDSGGPLVVNGKLVGVVSWGAGCARPEWPGVYAKVSYFRPWIMEKISKINVH